MCRLTEGDSLEVLRAAPDNSVDLVFTSPPYENARTYDIGYRLQGQDWVDWAFERFVECIRVSKGLVAWVVGNRTKNFKWTAVSALLIADLHRAGKCLRNPPIFHRVGVPGSGGPDWLRADSEWIICATSGGKLPWSDNTAMGHPPKWAPGGEMSHRLSDGTRRNQRGSAASGKSIRARGADGTKTGGLKPSHTTHTKRTAEGDMEEQDYKPPVLANPGNVVFCEREDGELEPGNVIRCKVGGGVMGNKLCHDNEAPFPEKLAELFVRSFCPPGGLVLDCFLGSGTVLDVAQAHGRNGWGVDIRASQIELTKKRLKEQA